MLLSQAVGHVVRMARVGANLTQQELAERAGLHFTAISRLERGDREPRLATLQAVAACFALPLWELLRDAEAIQLMRIGDANRR